MNESPHTTTHTNAPADPLPHVCPRHPEVTLTHLLKGGAGHCRVCNFFQQSANHPEPLRPTPRPSVKALAQAKRATKAQVTQAAAKKLSKPDIQRARLLKRTKVKAATKRNPMLRAKQRNPMLNESPPAQIAA